MANGGKGVQGSPALTPPQHRRGHQHGRLRRRRPRGHQPRAPPKGTDATSREEQATGEEVSVATCPRPPPNAEKDTGATCPESPTSAGEERPEAACPGVPPDNPSTNTGATP